MHIAVVGCGHGEVDKIYDVIANIEEKQGIKVELVLCCGDFQSVRNMTDLRCMACLIKYQHMHDFHRYYSGEKKAPILTLFIGGNHEASNFLQELPYGGWVASNIFYLGQVGVYRFGSLRIAGISGIYKGHDYLKGRHERAPYTQSTIRSVYHYRNLDIFRLKQIKQPTDIVLSHDWPKGIHQYGDFDRLLRQKPFFRDEIERNELGSRPLLEVLETLQPSYWFSAHMHVKFAAYVLHSPGTTTENDDTEANNVSARAHNNNPSGNEEALTSGEHGGQNAGKATRFLALDKVLPRRQFLQIIEIPTPDSGDSAELQFDPEWLAILKSTNDLVSAKENPCYMPGPGYMPRSDFSATEEEIKEVIDLLDNNLKVPLNFQQTGPVHIPGEQPKTALPLENPFTKEFCSKLSLVDPLSLLVSSEDMARNVSNTFDDDDYLDEHSQLDITLNRTSVTDDSFSYNPDEISIDLDDEGGNNESLLEQDADGSPINRQPSLLTRSRLVLPPPKNSGEDNDDNDNGVLSSRATALSLQEGNGTFKRSSLVLPPPKNEDTDLANDSTEGDNASLFFLDTDGEPNVKKRKDL